MSGRLQFVQWVFNELYFTMKKFGKKASLWSHPIQGRVIKKQLAINCDTGQVLSVCIILCVVSSGVQHVLIYFVMSDAKYLNYLKRMMVLWCGTRCISFIFFTFGNSPRFCSFTTLVAAKSGLFLYAADKSSQITHNYSLAASESDESFFVQKFYQKQGIEIN